MGGHDSGGGAWGGGARRDALCKVRRAWTSFHRAAISARSSAITLGDLGWGRLAEWELGV